MGGRVNIWKGEGERGEMLKENEDVKGKLK
jgi:hypothetical protein